MMKKTLCAAMLASIGLAAQAAPQQYVFSYTGFDVIWKYNGVESARSFVPDAEVRGMFTGEDLDHDGVLRKDELSELVVTSFSPVNVAPGCYDSSGMFHCDMPYFTYVLGGALSFGASTDYYHPEGAGAGYGVESGVEAYIWHSGYYGPSRETSFNKYLWTPATSLSVTAVPEPAGYAMLGLGLLGIAALRRRA